LLAPDQREHKLGSGRFTTDKAGYSAMRKYASRWPERVWAVEGANGVGRPLAERLLEAGEQVLDVPAQLAARVRLFDTGHNRKTDAHDAHAIAVVAVRTPHLRVLKLDGELEALRMLTDRREALTRRGVQTVCRLQALLAELLPGQRKPDITALQAKAMLASVRPRDITGKDPWWGTVDAPTTGSRTDEFPATSGVNPCLRRLRPTRRTTIAYLADDADGFVARADVDAEATGVPRERAL
jgi:transposase